MQLSTGPWSYNRFNAYEKSLEEGSKPDYLDFDGDGDKKEPMKKALKEKGKKEVKEGNCYQEGGKVEDKKEKKSPCEKCKEEGKKDCNCDDDKDDKKPAFLQKEAIIQSLMDDGLANNPVSAEVIAEHMSDEWKEAILTEKKSEAEREARRLEKEYEKTGEDKEKSDEIWAQERRQKEKDKTLGKTKKLRLRDKRKGEGLGVKPLANKAQKNAGRRDKAQPDIGGAVMRG